MELIERLKMLQEALNTANTVSSNLIEETISYIRSLDDEMEREFYRGHRVGYKAGYEARKEGLDEERMLRYVNSPVIGDDDVEQGSGS